MAAPHSPHSPDCRSGRPAADTSVVVATRNGCGTLGRSLRMLCALPEQPEVIVVDNASTDGTAELVAAGFPQVRLIRLRRNTGAAARNTGVRAALTPYVAFSDDDSWWEPGALARAAGLLGRHQRLAAVAARTLAGPDARVDPVSAAQAASPLPPPGDLPGPPVLGFLACAAVVRRSAFLAVGGFSPVLFFGAEEKLLAYDLAAAGWGIAYASEVTARHFPSPSRDRAGRGPLLSRNELLIGWMRRPLRTALARTWACARQARRDPAARRALVRAAIRLPAALASRRPLPPAVEEQARIIESAPGPAGPLTAPWGGGRNRDVTGLPPPGPASRENCRARAARRRQRMRPGATPLGRRGSPGRGDPGQPPA